MKADIKTLAEIEIMQEGGKYLSDILHRLVDSTAAGMTTMDIEKKAWEWLSATGGTPSFAKVPGYRWATCININDGVVHGIPDDTMVAEGDIVTIDVGLIWKGFNTDMGTTFKVKSQKSELNSQEDSELDHFLEVGRETLDKAIAQATIGNRVGDISWAIQENLERAGYNPIPTLTGHGVGKKLHEYPQIPGLLWSPVEQTPILKEGMTLAIEVIYAQGSGDTKTLKDGWTIATRDGKMAAVYEKTIAVVSDGPLLLTP